MTKLEFLSRCTDKYTNVEYNEGDVIEFEDIRADEILAVENGRYAKKVKETKRKKNAE